jgi:hypothetical protein
MRDPRTGELAGGGVIKVTLRAQHICCAFVIAAALGTGGALFFQTTKLEQRVAEAIPPP